MSTGPVTIVTSWPKLMQARAKQDPIRPLEEFVI
jgi:hypothetical protein